MSHRSRRPAAVATSLFAVALAASLASCSTSAASTSTPTQAATSAGATPQATDNKGTETPHAEPRLVVTTGDSAIVLDAETHKELGRFETDGSAGRVVVGTNGRVVYLTSLQTGVTRILDSGTFAAAHGDHAHFYVKDPSLTEQKLQGSEPVHQVSHSGKTAIFYDGTGVADVVTDSLAIPGPTKVIQVKSDGPQHGVVIPLDEGYLVSIAPKHGRDPLPTGVARLDADGKQIATYPSCPQLHGEAASDKAAAFGCKSDVLVVTADGAKNVPLPNKSGERVGELHASPESPIMVGDLAADSLALLNTDTLKITEVKVGATVAGITRTEDENAAVLTDQGEVILFDVATGKPKAKVKAIAPFEVPKEHDAPRPRLVIVGGDAHVSDPATKTLVKVPLSGKAKPTSTTLPGAPIALVATNNDHSDAESHAGDGH